ncbi:MAG: hypothetical protein V3W41_00285 [Planctomycetota bacterium]
MSRIRSLRVDDIPLVVDLFVESFRSGKHVSTEALQSYFHSVYFESPWSNPVDLPSLVRDEGPGKITAFLGVFPRRVRLDGKTLQAVVVGNFTVRPDASGRRDPFAAIGLTKHCLAGRQDISISDSAAESSRKIWEGCGGETCHLYSYQWFRPLRPMSFAIDRRAQGRPNSIGQKVTRALCGAADLIVGHRAYQAEATAELPTTVVPLEPEDLCVAIQQSSYQLIPDYAEGTLDWLLSMAAKKRGHGDFVQSIVKANDGKTLGWYIYYRVPNGISHVLQIEALPGKLELVMNALVTDADSVQSSGLFGKLPPRFMRDLSNARCVFRSGPWTLLHARRTGYLQPFYRGEACFSGLEGEGWLRFIGDDFPAHSGDPRKRA